MPKWKADEIFAKITARFAPENDPTLAAPVVAPRGNFDGPDWPRWYAQSEEDLLDDNVMTERLLTSFFAVLFGIPVLLVMVGAGIGSLISLFAVPYFFVKYMGRHAKAYSVWNIGFWSLYLGTWAILFLIS